MDEHDIIRIHGRNQDEHFTRTNRPILFGYRHPLTIFFIFSRHRCYNCSGVSYLLNKIRREIESPSLRRQIQETLSKCIVCRKILSRPFKYPENPPLNDYRTTCSRPFSMCGVDYVGPFPIYKNKEIDEITPNKKPKEPKTYVVLFTCLVSRAIYLVLVPDRKTETFLRALRELSARHCEPRLFLSDNEGAFDAANRVLQRISEMPDVIRELGKKNITWKFIPSRASWMGGVYERLVQIIKIELTKMQRKAKFNEIEWRSHLADIEQIVNDRPLTYVSDIPSEPEVVTPNSIIHGCLNDTTLATDLNIDTIISDMKQYQNHPESLYKEKVKLKTQFWNKIQQQYIAALNLSNYKKNGSKGKYSVLVPQLGGVVSIQDSETKLGGRLGIIVKLIQSSDGIVRKAEVKTTIPSPNISLTKNLKTEIRTKALNQLIPLELKVDNLTSLEILENTFTVDIDNSLSQEPSQI